MDNVLAVSTNTYHGFTLEQALKGIAKAGFKYVELTAVKGYTEHVDWQMTGEEIQSVKSKLRQYGLTPVALSGHSNLMEENGVINLLKTVELAAKLGCKFVVSATGEAHGDHEVIENDRKLIGNLERIVKKCEKNDVKLALETHGNNYASGKTMYDLVSRFDSDYIGITYDTANVIFYGNVRPEEDLKNGKDRIYHMHLKDKLGEKQEWNFPAIGKGYIDFETIFNILGKNNYQGPISVEIEFTAEGPDSLAAVNQAVKDSYDHLQRL